MPPDTSASSFPGFSAPPSRTAHTKKDAAHGLPTETEGVVDTLAKIVLGLGGGPGDDGLVDKLTADGTSSDNGAVTDGDGAH